VELGRLGEVDRLRFRHYATAYVVVVAVVAIVDVVKPDSRIVTASAALTMPVGIVYLCCGFLPFGYEIAPVACSVPNRA
jgi:hypothetical protein